MKRTLLYFILAFIAVILAACELNKTKPGKIIFDRVPFVYATINGQRELFLIVPERLPPCWIKSSVTKRKSTTWLPA